MNEGDLRRILGNRGDLYSVLGVSETADPTAIRRAYHRLMLHLHPDKSSAAGSDPRLAEACSVVISAYEVLGDAQRRQTYDRYGLRGVQFFEAHGAPPSTRNMLLRLAMYFLRFIGMSHYGLWLDVDLGPARRWGVPREDQERAEAEEADEMLRTPEGRTRHACRFVAVRVFAALVAAVALLALAVPVPPPDYRGAVVATAAAVDPAAVGLVGVLLPAADGQAPTGFLEVDTRCLELHGGPDAVAACLAQQNLSSTVRRRVPYYCADADRARRAAAVYAAQRCEQEAALLAASRNRYEPTATFPRHDTPLVYRSPNKTPAGKRKYARRTWRPRYRDTFSVRSADELFTPSVWCAAALTETSST